MHDVLPDRCRLLIEAEARSGAQNMAIDEALLESASTSDHPTVRLYRWSQPTISLGHFQRDVSAVPDSLAEVPTVRRLSGGGAILHHHELTYSVTLPKTHPFCSDPRQLYGPVHQVVIDLLAEHAVESRFRGASDAEKDGQFLCFLRGDAQDVVMGKHKILGSAQRRRRGAVLQHGSLLLKHSPLAPDLPGILDLKPNCEFPADFGFELADRIAGVIARGAKQGTLSEAELEFVAGAL